MHGCKPSGAYHKITKADENVILEIDGRTWLEEITRMLGTTPDRNWEEYPLFVTLGLNKGDKFGEFKEENYANRLCMAGSTRAATPWSCSSPISWQDPKSA